jgi:hypothetical protein
MELWNRRATNKYASAAYDFLLVIVAFFFAIAPQPWVLWAVFLIVNLAGLFVFNNRFIRRGLTLVHPWWVLLGLLMEAGLWVSLQAGTPQDGGRTLMAIVGFAFVVAVRLCFEPAEAPTGKAKAAPQNAR